jgi:DnaK suppressor protein
MLDLAEARRRLEADRGRIRERIASESAILPSFDGSPTESGYGTHAADRASETYEEEKALGLRSHFEGELVDVEDALRRVDDGTYGTCAECGRQISPERLEAMPAARLCIDCQSKVKARR